MSEDQIASTPDPLERLFLRLLTAPYDARNRQPRLFVGALPEHFPLEVPIPGQTLVLGTLARSEEHVEIVLESELAQDECMAFYRAEFTSRGWQVLDHLGHMGGFTHDGIGPHNFLIFCQGEDGASVTLNIVQLENMGTDIRLHVNLGHEGNPCGQRRQMRRHMMPRHDLIPPLSPPAGAQQHPSGASGSDDEWYSNALLKTELALDVLEQHYNAQLSKGGWTQLATGASGPVAWSTWTFRDEEQQPWGGLFFVLQKPDRAQEYILYARAERERADGESHFANWFGDASSTGIIRNPRYK